jgi:hypothetical protein
VFRALRQKVEIFGYDPVRLMAQLVVDEFQSSTYPIRTKLFGNSDVGIDCADTTERGIICVIDFGVLGEE